MWDRATWVTVSQRIRMETETLLEHTLVSDRPRMTFVTLHLLFLTLHFWVRCPTCGLP